MNLKFLNNLDLDARVKSLWSQERAILHELLLTLKEMESRRGYLEMGFSSLFDYLVREIGCDGGTAQRRIDAVRLMRDVPLVSEKIQSGELSLNKISLIQSACREVKKTRDVKVTAAEKAELVAVVLEKDFKTSQKEIAQYLDIPVMQTPVQIVQADESVRYEFTVSKELDEKIKQAHALLSHAIGTNDIVAFVEYVADRIIRQKTSVRAEKRTSKSTKTEEPTKLNTLVSASKFTSARNESAHQNDSSQGEIESQEANAFSVRNKKIILKKDQCCQFVDPLTLRKCDSKWFLQVDHLRPQWAGGSGHIENGQILCAAHNNFKYSREIGVRKV